MDSTRMVNTEEAGSVRKKVPLTEYLLPPNVLCEKFGLGFVAGSIFGFIHHQVKDVSGDPWGTRLGHGFRAGQCMGSKFAYCPVIVASVEHLMATLRGKSDPLNTFVGGTVLGGIAVRGTGRGPFLASAALSLLMGSYITLLEYAHPPSTPERTAPTSLQTAGA